MTKEPVIRTPVGTAPAVPVLLMLLGGYLTWFGVHYWRSDTAYPTDPLKAVLTGKPIPTPDRSASEAAVTSIVNSAPAAGSGGSTLNPAATSPAGGGGDAIAAAALKYIGATYVHGGPADRVGNWDCSSFVSFILGHECGYSLPGGKWGDPGMPPHAHGPVTTQYMLWGKPVSRSQVQKGDLIVSAQHMGIVVTENTYMSAKTPSAGTGLDMYDHGFPGGTPVFRRVT